MKTQIQKIIADKIGVKADKNGFFFVPETNTVNVAVVAEIVSELQLDIKVQSIQQQGNLHIIKVTTQNSTRTKPAYVKLKSEKFAANKAILLGYNYYDLLSDAPTDNVGIASKWLEENGFNVVATAEGKNCMYILTDRFKPLVK